MDKVILITGASSGFGKLVAEKLLDLGGWTVYATARRVPEMEDLRSKGAHIAKMDVTKEEDVQQVLAQILEKEGRIDALLANAGYGEYGMVETVPMENIRYQYEVNVFGVARCLQAVLPQMRRQKSGRIVITESLASRISTVGLGWYASTKHALKAISTSLRQEVGHLGIEVVSIEPGGVDTGFKEVAFDLLKRIDYPVDYQRITNDFHAYMAATYRNSPSIESTVAAMVKALTVKRPKAVYKTTLDAKIIPKITAVVPDKVYDWFVLRMMGKAGKKAKKEG